MIRCQPRPPSFPSRRSFELITLVTQPFAAIETDALVSYVFEETDLVQGRIAEIDRAAGGLLRKLAKSGELTSKMLEFTLVHAQIGRATSELQSLPNLVCRLL